MSQQDDDFTGWRFTLIPHDPSSARRTIDGLSVIEAIEQGDEHPQARRHRCELACRIAEARKARVKMFPGDIFDEPAWDILLALYCAAGRNKVSTMASLGQSIGAPCSTMKRWIRQLIERDLVEDHEAVRLANSNITLSRNGFLRLDAYFRMLLDRHFQV